MLDKKGFDTIQAAAKPGVSPQKLSDELRAALPASVQVRTGQQEAAKQSSDIRSNLGFLKIALLAFAGISLFVGAFLIFNTFSITVAQRSREIALLRTLGASRRQVLRSVILEGLLVGCRRAACSASRSAWPPPAGCKELFKAFGADLPSGGSVLATRTIVLTVLVGAVVSVVSSIAPAIRATRVAPIEALTESAAPVSKRASRRLTIGALALLALGVGLMCLGLFAQPVDQRRALGRRRRRGADVHRRRARLAAPRARRWRRRSAARSSASRGSRAGWPARTPCASPGAPRSRRRR